MVGSSTQTGFSTSGLPSLIPIIVLSRPHGTSSVITIVELTRHPIDVDGGTRVHHKEAGSFIVVPPLGIGTPVSTSASYPVRTITGLNPKTSRD